jgi:hypothetical protein
METETTSGMLFHNSKQTAKVVVQGVLLQH